VKLRTETLRQISHSDILHVKKSNFIRFRTDKMISLRIYVNIHIKVKCKLEI